MNVGAVPERTRAQADDAELALPPAHELAQLAAALRAWVHGARADAALATLTATRGSTFRHAGAHMLVHRDGRVVGELSGGCPQRDIVLRAQRAIASGEPCLVRYDAASGLDVLMEMGCGGSLEVLIEPLAAGSRTAAFFDALADGLARRQPARAATLFALDGVAIMPRRALWTGAGPCCDEIGDPALLAAIADAPDAFPARPAATLRLPFAGATADVLVECIAPAHALIAIGAGATARALLALGHALGWHTTLVDADSRRLRGTYGWAMRTLCASPNTLRARLALDRCSSVMVMTHHLDQDRAWLAALDAAPIAYLGVLGSRARAARLCSQTGPRLHAPAGLDVGSETPAEMALSIAAEIVAARNGRSGGSLREHDGAIHP